MNANINGSSMIPNVRRFTLLLFAFAVALLIVGIVRGNPFETYNNASTL